MACYTFSVRPIIPESENLKIAMKKLMKKKMKTFAKRSILSLRPLISAKNKHFEEIFGLDGVFNAELKTDFRKSFVMASSS